MTEPAPIAWSRWSASAFAEAARLRRPVLLAIGAAWCEACARMDAHAYDDPRVRALAAGRFVPVRVDAERRPDVAERYGLGAWPTCVCLTPGGEVLDGATFLDADELTSLLARVADVFDARRDEIAARAHTAAAGRSRDRDRERDRAHDRVHDRVHDNDRPGEGAAGTLAWLRGRMLRDFDARHGGFGDAPKLPHAPALELALVWHRAGDAAMRAVVTRSLDAMAADGLHDRVEGGVFRYCEARDWSRPHTEKRLADNAECLRLRVDAWRTLGRAADRAAADAILDYVTTTLWSPEDTGFYDSQRADAAYYRLDSPASRGAMVAPPVDRTVYAAANARMIAALLELAEAAGADGIRDRALAALERLLMRAFRPGRGVAHVVANEPDVWGLLADQVRVGAAVVEACRVTGDPAYLDVAQEIMLFAVRTMWDERGGGFLDRAAGVNDADEAGAEVDLMREPVTLVDLNAEAARVLFALARLTGRADYWDRGRAALATCDAPPAALGLLAAPVGLALEDVALGPDAPFEDRVASST